MNINTSARGSLRAVPKRINLPSRRATSIPLIASIALLLSMGIAPRLRAQVVGATLSGTITDPSGGAIAKAEISIRNSATSITRIVLTNGDGFYSAPNLLPGDYAVTTSAAGFASATTNITLTVGARQALNLILRVGQASESVRVTGAAPNVDLVDSAIGGVKDETTVRELPLNGRSWSDLANLQPGVYTIHTQPDVAIRDRYNRGYGAQLTISGARPQQNNYRLDGISINDPTNGAPGSVLGGNMGVDAISEFSVLTTNYSTEYGRASGGIINATTKSGSNQFHGDVYEFLRNSALDARNFFDIKKPPFRRNQFGASAGGPIQKGKTFIFGDYEGLRQVLNLSQSSPVPSDNARKGILSGGGPVVTSCPAGSSILDPNANTCVDNQVARFLAAFYPHVNVPTAGDTGFFVFGRPQTTSENYFTVRVDHRFSDKDSLHGTYFRDYDHTLVVDEFKNKSIDTLTHRNFVTIEESHIFGPALFNSARFGFHRFFVGGPASTKAINPLAADPSYGFVPGDSAGQIIVGGLQNFSGGLSAASPQLDHWNSWQFYDDAFHTRGIHSLKFGANVERIEYNRFYTPRPGGQFNFGSLSAFLQNQPNSLTADSPTTITPRGIRQTIVGVYVQDDVRLRPNLTVNLGLRYEPATVLTEVHGKVASLLQLTDALPRVGPPLYHNNTLRNFEPRVGFAWDPFRNGRTSVRGGFGFYDQLPLPSNFGNPVSTTIPFYQSVSISSGSNPTTSLQQGDFPTNAFLKGSTNSERIAIVEQNPHRSYVMQWNVSVQRELMPNLAALIGYVGSHGVHGITQDDDVNIVRPIPSPQGYLWPCEPFVPGVGCTGIGTGQRLNTSVGREPAILFRNSSVYHGLEAQLTKRMSHGFQIQTSFTWQKSIDTASGGVNGDTFINGISSLFIFDPRLTRGLADFNVGRVFTANALWNVPGAKSLSGVIGGFLRGWQLAGVFSASDGVPFTPLLAGDPLGTNSTDAFAYPDRLTTPGCSSLVNPGNVNNYIKIQCFALPPTVNFQGHTYIRLGNAGRNIIPGPGLVNLDFSVVKNTYVKRISETFNVQFRAEMFNILNHANFNVPVDNGQQTLLDPSKAGIGIVPADPATAIVSGAGVIDATATISRQVQFAMKVIW